MGGLFVVFGAPEAHAQSSASTRVDLYTDESIQVVSPSARGSVLFDEQEVEAGFGVDVVSGATLVLESDLTSSATTFEETRTEAHLTISSDALEDWTLGGGYNLSSESDYKTQAFNLFFDRELFEGMSTLSVSTSLSLESMGRADDPESFEGIVAPSLDLAWTQILDEKTVLHFMSTFGSSFCGARYGCQANPYRFVAIEREEAAPLALREKHPEERFRGAWAVKASRAFGEFSAFHLNYRFYADSWQVTGHTAEAVFASSLLDERLFLRANLRGVLQGAAGFFSSDFAIDSPSELPRYRSADEELSGVKSALIGGRAEWSFHALGPFLSLALGARGFYAWYAYKFHERRRQALVLGTDLVAEF